MKRKGTGPFFFLPSFLFFSFFPLSILKRKFLALCIPSSGRTLKDIIFSVLPRSLGKVEDRRSPLARIASRWGQRHGVLASCRSDPIRWTVWVSWAPWRGWTDQRRCQEADNQGRKGQQLITWFGRTQMEDEEERRGGEGISTSLEES